MYVLLPNSEHPLIRRWLLLWQRLIQESCSGVAGECHGGFKRGSPAESCQWDHIHLPFSVSVGQHFVLHAFGSLLSSESHPANDENSNKHFKSHPCPLAPPPSLSCMHTIRAAGVAKTMPAALVNEAPSRAGSGRTPTTPPRRAACEVEIKAYSFITCNEFTAEKMCSRCVSITTAPIPFDPDADLVALDLAVTPARVSAQFPTDLLIAGVEASLWMAEQWAADLRIIFSQLNVVTLSTNKLLGLGEINHAKDLFPGADETYNIKDSPLTAKVVDMNLSDGCIEDLTSLLTQTIVPQISQIVGWTQTAIRSTIRLRVRLAYEAPPAGGRRASVWWSSLGVDVHGASGGVLIASEAVVLLTAQQAAFIRNPDYRFEGNGPEIVTVVGHNPYKPSMGLAHNIVLHGGTSKQTRRKFVDEYLYDRLFLTNKPFTTSILRSLRSSIRSKAPVRRESLVKSNANKFRTNLPVVQETRIQSAMTFSNHSKHRPRFEALSCGAHHIDPSVLIQSKSMETTVFADFVMLAKATEAKVEPLKGQSELRSSHASELRPSQIQFYECRIASLERLYLPSANLRVAFRHLGCFTLLDACCHLSPIQRMARTATSTSSRSGTNNLALHSQSLSTDQMTLSCSITQHSVVNKIVTTSLNSSVLSASSSLAVRLERIQSHAGHRHQVSRLLGVLTFQIQQHRSRDLVVASAINEFSASVTCCLSFIVSSVSMRRVVVVSTRDQKIGVYSQSSSVQWYRSSVQRASQSPSQWLSH
eukprot:gene28040-34833_t